MLFNNVLELIGNTPMVYYNDNIMLKLESYNPSGSIKDRASFEMINNSLERGEIDKNTIIIEPTSGNTGIGLAMVCAFFGLKLIICMPENMSEERQKAISAYGAEIVLTPAEDGMKGSVDKVFELKEKYPHSWIPMQFSNNDNLKAHKQTANEILEDTGHNVDIVIAGIGTGGTAFGLRKYLPKEIKVFGVEPEESPLFTKGKSGTHKIQGIGANFIPELCLGDLDDIRTVESDLAIEEAKNLAKEKGIFVGISSGAALAIAKKISLENPDKIIVAIMPDSGDRYLSAW